MIVLKFYSEKSESVSQSLSHVQLFVSPLTVAHQALLSMELSRQEYWRGLPCPPPEDLPNPGTEHMSPDVPTLQAYSLPLSSQGSPSFAVKVKVKSLGHVRLFVTPWTVAYEAPLSMGFSRQ